LAEKAKSKKDKKDLKDNRPKSEREEIRKAKLAKITQNGGKKKKNIKRIGQMFLRDDFERKTVEANKDNMEYYNKWYDEQKSDAAVKAALEEEEHIRLN